jgi:hypothetical protein
VFVLVIWMCEYVNVITSNIQVFLAQDLAMMVCDWLGFCNWCLHHEKLNGIAEVCNAECVHKVVSFVKSIEFRVGGQVIDHINGECIEMWNKLANDCYCAQIKYEDFDERH